MSEVVEPANEWTYDHSGCEQIYHVLLNTSARFECCVRGVLSDGREVIVNEDWARCSDGVLGSHSNDDCIYTPYFIIGNEIYFPPNVIESGQVLPREIFDQLVDTSEEQLQIMDRVVFLNLDQSNALKIVLLAFANVFANKIELTDQPFRGMRFEWKGYSYAMRYVEKDTASGVEAFEVFLIQDGTNELIYQHSYRPWDVMRWDIFREIVGQWREIIDIESLRDAALEALDMLTRNPLFSNAWASIFENCTNHIAVIDLGRDVRNQITAYEMQISDKGETLQVLAVHQFPDDAIQHPYKYLGGHIPTCLGYFVDPEIIEVNPELITMGFVGLPSDVALRILKQIDILELDPDVTDSLLQL